MLEDHGDDTAGARAAVRARRRARTADERSAAAQDLARTVVAGLEERLPGMAGPDGGPGRDVVVAAYLSTPTEPGTAPLREALAARGATVLLPVVGPVVGPGGEGPLTWVVDAEGSPRASLDTADVVLLPALAVTASGHRLGQGGGHYDRTLAALVPASGRRPLLVALVHDDEVLADGSWPVEDHDAGVDAAATPSRWIDSGGPRPGPPG